MQKPMRNYSSYLLRVWRPEEGETAGWRAYLQDLATGRSVGFANVDSLVAFLEAACAAPVTHVQRKDEGQGDSSM